MAKYGLTPQGPNPKRLDAILDDMHERMSARLGVNTRQNPQSLLNHLLTNVADEIAELWEFGVDVYHSEYVSSATGVSLDYAAQFGGSTRGMAAKSYYSILCTGVDGTAVRSARRLHPTPARPRTLFPAQTQRSREHPSTRPPLSLHHRRLQRPLGWLLTETYTPSPLTQNKAPAKP